MSAEPKGVRWTEAIVLGGIDVGESDRIVHLLSIDVGRLSGVAKAARVSVRRFAGTLEPFSTIAVRYRERRGTPLAFFYEAEVRAARLGIRRALWRFGVASYVVELARELGRDREANRALFGAAEWGLDVCANGDARADLLVAYEMKALEAAGLAPVVDACVACGVVDVVGFDPSRAGAVCEGCETPSVHRLSRAAMRSLARVRGAKADAATTGANADARASFRAVSNAMGAFVEYQLARKMRARAFAVEEIERVCGARS